ncbi:MAG TPA: thiamine pyrophosphate-dependent enzyme, partial [Polyangiaceae bacterium]|nr:thiamine pyrophosphate-dependent enzyme [Polyangiaceae bacterium]
DPAAASDFARALRLPVVTTMSARGEFTNDNPLYLGMLGSAGHPSVHDFLRDEADLLLVAGTGMGAMSRGPLASGALDLARTRIAAINLDPGELERGFAPYQTPASLPLQLLRADAGAAFRTLLELWGEAPFYKPLFSDYERSYYKPCLAQPIEGGPASGVRGSLLQSDALAILAEHTPQAGHVLFDAGNCAAAALHYVDVEPGVSSTIALGMGGMGYALAGAIGAQLGSLPGTRTLVFAGDGAFLMTGFEVHTAVDLKLPILFVVFNNNMHGMCAVRQQLYFGSRYESVRYPAVDLSAVARGFADPDALWVGAARSAKELYQRLDEYYNGAADRPGVLELCLAQEEMPPFAPFLPADAPRTGKLRASVPPPRRALRSLRARL